MALIPKSLFPDVPNLPGVPQLRRSKVFPSAPPPVLGVSAALTQLWRAINARVQWGIFKADANNNNQLVQVLLPDSVIDFGYTNEFRVSDFPVQEGSFATYNKVASPFEVMVRMSKAGTAADRSAFLSNLDAVLASLDLFTVITPEKVYSNCNMTRLEVIRRGAKGAYFLTDVDLYLREIRQITPQFSNTAAATQNAQDPDALGPVNQGFVSSQPWNSPVFRVATSVGG